MWKIFWIHEGNDEIYHSIFSDETLEKALKGVTLLDECRTSAMFTVVEIDAELQNTEREY